MTYRTPSQWMDRGFIIRAGERSHFRDNYGRACFNRDQVRVRHQPWTPRGQWVFVPG